MVLRTFAATAALALCAVAARPGPAQASGLVVCRPDEARKAELGQSRRALVVGNGAYRPAAPGSGRRRGFDPLESPPIDAERMVEALCALGFEVRALRDADADALRAAVAAFRRDNEADSAREQVRVVYYSGHGVEVASANYIVPVSAAVETARDEGVGFPDIYDAAAAGAGPGSGRRALKVLLFDACRSWLRGEPRLGGLAQPQQGAADTVVGYATVPGEVAASSPGGQPSRWTAALLRSIRQPGLELGEFFGRVHEEVREGSHGHQRPATFEARAGAFYFNPAPRIVWRVNAVDDQLRVRVAGTDVFQSRVREASSGEMPFDVLQTGGGASGPPARRYIDTPFEVLLHNQRTNRGGNSWGRREGWNYSLDLLIGTAPALQMRSAGEPGDRAPPDERWGAEFVVQRGTIRIDREAGTVTAVDIAAPEGTFGSCTVAGTRRPC